MADHSDAATAAADTVDTERARRVGRIQRNQVAIQLLDGWLAETDPDVIAEQQETLAYLEQALVEEPIRFREVGIRTGELPGPGHPP